MGELVQAHAYVEQSKTGGGGAVGGGAAWVVRAYTNSPESSDKMRTAHRIALIV